MLQDYLAEHIAEEIYHADCRVRNFMVRGFTEHSERSYMGALAQDAAVRLMPEFWLPTFSFRIDVRDRHTHDGIFVFRYKDEVKVGICESKMLRLTTANGGIIGNLNTQWDNYQEGTSNSHFTKQILKYRNWQTQCAVWCMFMLDLPLGQLSPFDPLGSDCIWLDKVYDHYKNNIHNPSYRWTYQDLHTIPSHDHLNLKEIVRSILMCEKGIPFPVDSLKSSITIKIKRTTKEIPIPSLKSDRYQFQEIVETFLNDNNLSFYRYFGDLPLTSWSYSV